MAVKKDSEKKEQTDSLIRKLSILGKINEAVSRTLQLQESMDATLRILQQSYHIRSGAVFLAENGRNLVITASIGYNRNIRKTAYHFGEGLTGRVAETGKPIVVPQVSKEPLFLNRMSSWNPKRDGEQTFIGIPIISDYATLGVLIINLKYNPKRHLSNTLKFLMLVGSALAQPIRFNRLLKMEREKILNERVLLDERLKEKFSFQNIIGNSNEMRDVYEKVAQVARADTTVLIRGESGTGKELIAQAIHFNSARKDKSFIRVNCAAIPESLIESEFFGHEKGAFTGALIRKKGRFELANGGTIFLDEIGELSPLTQVKLLRVLQEHEFEQVGGTETIKVNVRVITATNADLEKLIAGG
ncbi:MAG TPA: GAF domain-containing protein, partial [Bacteroidetes bacterium]|nr:GAF domain-containing protein [Bacteroidota bacterium]